MVNFPGPSVKRKAVTKPLTSFFSNKIPKKDNGLSLLEKNSIRSLSENVDRNSKLQISNISKDNEILKSNLNSNLKTTDGIINDNNLHKKYLIEKKFNKNDWINSLTNEQHELLKLEINTLDDSWLEVLYPELTKPYFLELKKFLKKEYAAGPVFPTEANIYSWSRLTPFDKVKVVILGQDPYHGTGQAHGLAFSVLPKTPIPPSLRNIYIALHNDYPDIPKVDSTKPAAGYLLKWAHRGVLLLNTCLTVRAHNANSHANHGWEKFTEAVLRAVINAHKPVVFIAWGTPAAKRVETLLPGSTKGLPGPEGNNKYKDCFVLKSVHPSPLSASRGYFNCGHFKAANKWLEEKYGPSGVIDWDLNPKLTQDHSENNIDREKKT